MDPSIAPTGPPSFKLVPVFLINLKLEGAPAPVFTDKAGSKTLNLARVLEGEITTVKNDLGLELQVSGITGFDDITNHLEDDFTTLDCKLYGKTPEGAGVYITYDAVVTLGEPMVKVVTGEPGTPAFEDGYITNSPRIQFDKSVSDNYTWVTKENLIGRGRFARNEKKELHVQYYVYVMR